MGVQIARYLQSVLHPSILSSAFSCSSLSRKSFMAAYTSYWRSKRVFVLGPSHHVYLDHCALSACAYYSTPLGKLTLDTDVLKEIYKSGEKFGWMSLDTDEDEHSIEMHLPYIYKVLDLVGKVCSVKVVPIMVGAINTNKEKAYGEVLAKYLRDPENVFVISSDFCHW